MDEKLAGVLSVGNLFDDYGSILKIPEYQRPYSWEEMQVVQFLDDLEEAWEKDIPTYLIGNLIIHKDGKDWNIVDGQQRVVTLLLLMRAIEEAQAPGDSLKVSPLSINAVRNNLEIIKRRIKRMRDQKWSFANYLKERVVLTYTIATSLDEAFTYFDSQNTRGRPLARKDLLKVHHLGNMMKDNRSEYLAEQLVRRWELTECATEDDAQRAGDDYLEYLLDQLLGIPRKSIRGELQSKDLKKLDVYKEFLSEGGGGELNNYNQPPIFESYDYDLERNEIRFTTKAIRYSTCGAHALADGERYLPFEITQSMDGGERFFLYVFKYANLERRLAKEYPFYTMLDSLWSAGNVYLRKIYRASLLYYYDKFGERGFMDFSVHIYLLLSCYRANAKSVGAERVKTFKWDKNARHELDPFKLIMLKYSPSHVVSAIREYLKNNMDDPDSRDGFDGSGERLIWREKGVAGVIQRFCTAYDSTIKDSLYKLEEEIWVKK